MRKLLILVLFLMGCGQSQEYKFHMVFDSVCDEATPELLEYTEQAAEEFFGDKCFANDVYINNNLDAEGYWFLNGIAILCGTPQEMCNRIMHEYGHGASYARFGDSDENHDILMVYWDYWYTYPCTPEVMEERGFNNGS